MVYKLYDTTGSFTGHIEADNPCIESDLQSGDKTLTFSVASNVGLKNEYYVRTDKDEFVVKEIQPDGDRKNVTCALNLDGLETIVFEKYTAEKRTVIEMCSLAISETGWNFTTDISDKLRSVQTFKATPLQILSKIKDAFMAEIMFDTLNKVVSIKEHFGADKGAYFMSGLNLKEIRPVYDTYDYYTRIIPIGKDDLRVSKVNPTGKDYIDNTQYSNKVKVLIWEDTSYDNAQELYDDAVKKLDDISKPKASYSANIIDLAVQNSEYTCLSYELGDNIKIIDDATEIMTKQRIVKMTEYPDYPENNTCELSNTVLTFEDLQSKLQAAADAWDDATNSDGTIKGMLVHGVRADGVVGIETVVGNEISNSDTINGHTQSITEINGQIGEVDKKILDIDKAIPEAAKTATNFLEFSSDGLTIGDKQDGSFKGSRAVIDANSFSVRNDTNIKLADVSANGMVLKNNANEVLANFSADDIMIGQNKVHLTTEDYTVIDDEGNKVTGSATNMYSNGNRYVVSQGGEGMVHYVPKNGESYISVPRNYLDMKSDAEKIGVATASTTIGSNSELEIGEQSTTANASLFLKTKVDKTNTVESSAILRAKDVSMLSLEDETFISSAVFITNDGARIAGPSITLQGAINIKSSDCTGVLGKPHTLWEGAAHMGANQQITLSEPISKQVNGIVLVWSSYNAYTQTVNNYDFMYFFVSKYHIMNFNGLGQFMSNPYVGFHRYVYVFDTYIIGHQIGSQISTSNGIAYDYSKHVLQKVVGV